MAAEGARRMHAPLQDVRSGAQRGEAFGRHVHSWVLGGNLDELDTSEAGGAEAAASADPVASGACDIPQKPSVKFDTSDAHPDCATDSSGGSSESDEAVSTTKLHRRRAKRALCKAQHDTDCAMREKRRKVKVTMASLAEEKQKLCESLAEVQAAHEATKALLSIERATVDTITARIDEVRTQKLALEGQIEKSDEAAHRAVGRAKLLGGELDSIKQCSEHELDTLIRDTTEALSRMQRERAERTQTATRCVVCLDRAKILLLRPCNHLCLCETCGGIVQHCPLCRQAVEEKVRVHA
eukprot:gnl/TRDRNA2_/TRDRNA2_205806_c0_seq1.p1 gnl/TRDRNA2_/TRDRNA2_205806_c0~~gnl/TRDRNA2_/TRDRNA2_205806_c0_seq1.p1  ORF type:complete len:297 (+),score=49.70 gnl/TRDRNA2_/TRDRNA2_205806_c0_seq1:49-939(+)